MFEQPAEQQKVYNHDKLGPRCVKSSIGAPHGQHP